MIEQGVTRYWLSKNIDSILQEQDYKVSTSRTCFHSAQISYCWLVSAFISDLCSTRPSDWLQYFQLTDSYCCYLPDIPTISSTERTGFLFSSLASLNICKLWRLSGKIWSLQQDEGARLPWFLTWSIKLLTCLRVRGKGLGDVSFCLGLSHLSVLGGRQSSLALFYQGLKD